MKILIAQMEHETNTFSPVPTPWESFGPGGAYLGKDALQAMKGTRTPIGAFIDLAEKEGAEIVTPVAGFAYPSGPVDGAALRLAADRPGRAPATRRTAGRRELRERPAAPAPRARHARRRRQPLVGARRRAGR